MLIHWCNYDCRNGTNVITKMNECNERISPVQVGNAFKLSDFEPNVYERNGEGEKKQQLQHVARAFADICRALCHASTLVRSV